MKQNLRRTFAFAAFFIALTCSVSAFGQIKTGGYKSVSVADAGVKEAADFAISQKAEELEKDISLEVILKAERQTVAGTNYRLCMTINVPPAEEGAESELIFIKTVIYRNLKGEFSIKSWDEVECGE